MQPSQDGRTIPAADDGVEDALQLLQSIGLNGLAEVEYQVGPDRTGCRG